MRINTSHYNINGQLIEWGKPFNEVNPLLEKFIKFIPYGGKPNIRCKGTEIFGLKSTEAEVRAPFEDKPVMQVIYQLSPISPSFFEKLHTPYLKQLVKVLGKPYEEKSNYNPSGYSKEYISGAVIFSAKWLFDDIRISLSVYGGTRNEDSGPTAAGIFINWVNEKKKLQNPIEKG